MRVKVLLGLIYSISRYPVSIPLRKRKRKRSALRANCHIFVGLATIEFLNQNRGSLMMCPAGIQLLIKILNREQKAAFINFISLILLCVYLFPCFLCVFVRILQASPDCFLSEDHAIGLSTFTVMAGLGGGLGYAMGGVNWDANFIGGNLELFTPFL